jgi:glucokinase
MSDQVLAIDIGGTKIAVALVAADGTVVAETISPTTSSADPEAVFAPAAVAIRSALDHYESAHELPLRVGIGSAGPINAPAGTISPVNIAAWRDFPVSERVADVVLGQLRIPPRVGLAGDGHCFALGEHLGHISVNAWGPRCVCGGHGCTEMYARGPALVAAARQRGWSGGDAQALTADARAGDEIAIAVIDAGMRALAAGIATTATELDVTTFVLGGGVSKAGEVIFGPLRRHLRDFAVLDYVTDLEVRPAILENAGLLGAAALAFSLE